MSHRTSGLAFGLARALTMGDRLPKMDAPPQNGKLSNVQQQQQQVLSERGEKVSFTIKGMLRAAVGWRGERPLTRAATRGEKEKNQT